MTREYQVTYSDCSELTFYAENQKKALEIAKKRAFDFEDFTIKFRYKSEKPWASITRISSWELTENNKLKRIP